MPWLFSAHHGRAGEAAVGAFLQHHRRPRGRPRAGRDAVAHSHKARRRNGPPDADGVEARHIEVFAGPHAVEDERGSGERRDVALF